VQLRAKTKIDGKLIEDLKKEKAYLSRKLRDKEEELRGKTKLLDVWRVHFLSESSTSMLTYFRILIMRSCLSIYSLICPSRRTEISKLRTRNSLIGGWFAWVRKQRR
jgi:hypothetical protein